MGLVERATRLREAFADLLAQEFDWSAGHLTTVLNGCIFAPSLFTFWFVNGLLDFSTAFVIGSIASPGGLVVRLVAYVLLIPTFLLMRISYYLLHPTHRKTVLSGACPQSQLLSLDWFSVGILATGLPLALQDFGPWVGMNAIFVVGIFVLPRFVRTERVATATKFGAIVLGVIVFLYANYGEILSRTVGITPSPAAVLGPIATLTLSEETTTTLLGVMNSVVSGPVTIAVFAVVMNWMLTREELTTLPMVRHALPQYDPPQLVVVSSALGTVFYLSVVAMYTGQLQLLP